MLCLVISKQSGQLPHPGSANFSKNPSAQHMSFDIEKNRKPSV